MKNTACKSRTINPVWKETFVLDVSEDLEEVLHVDVWNFMPDEKLREKLRKINEFIHKNHFLRMGNTTTNTKVEIKSQY